MPYTTYHASCHCGDVRFEADVDLSAGTTKCNCTYCFKNRYWSLSVFPDRFREIASPNVAKSGSLTPGRCARCGVLTFARVTATDWNPVDHVAISVAAFDDIDPTDLASAPVTHCDGLHDNWWAAPAEVRHL
ncbi:GFA family protein [Pelagovum pacificum]|uniref:GFA family protein n=1 Tax=Pelagovum pacificum TaxID=2588711 RepID=A0A5C5GCP0_9RHOB|nr:GFA family protein [Pelagovum pacificum]QQA42275.1 GFA family protein [Pelagovum pacificum]TNY31359.1 GFA family protein [Pelagovum pacificum]